MKEGVYRMERRVKGRPRDNVTKEYKGKEIMERVMACDGSGGPGRVCV